MNYLSHVVYATYVRSLDLRARGSLAQQKVTRLAVDYWWCCTQTPGGTLRQAAAYESFIVASGVEYDCIQYPHFLTYTFWLSLCQVTNIYSNNPAGSD